MHHYPTKEQLDAMGATLERDVALCTANLHRWLHGAQTQAVRTDTARLGWARRIVAWPRRRAGKRIA